MKTMRITIRKMKKTNKKTGSPFSGCEYCEYYDYNDESDQYECKMDLDEDEMSAFLSGFTAECHYFKYYDEYKSVSKQN